MNVKQQNRGRDATKPHNIPARGWLDILIRVWQEMGNDHVSLVAAGVAMFAMLATFPGLAALVSLFGLLASTTDVGALMAPLLPLLPHDVAYIISAYLMSAVTENSTTLSTSAVIGLVLAMWSARRGMAALIRACSVVYEEPRRGFFSGLFLSIAFTTLGLVLAALVLSIGLILPIIVEMFNVSTWVERGLNALRWFALWVIFIGTLGAIYRYAPNRKNARWPWVSVGAITAASICIFSSLGFSYYVKTWANYGESYGALGGVVVMLLWFYITSYTIIFGAELNAEIEHQTLVDTTVGPAKPLGQRGAYVADSVGKAYESAGDNKQS